MRTISKMLLASSMALALAACGSTTTERAATGGMGGVAAGALVGGPVGAVVGGAAGAAAGSTLDEPVDQKVGEWVGGNDSSDRSARATRASGNQQGMSRDEIRRVQQALRDSGHDIAVDGIWGPNTRRAVRDFQQANGLDATGRVDRRTMAALEDRTNQGSGQSGDRPAPERAGDTAPRQ